MKAGLQLGEDVHLGKSPQVMQVTTSVPCHHDSLTGCIHQVNVRDSQARCNAYWKCGGSGHFQKDCKAMLNCQGVDTDEMMHPSLDTNPTIGWMSHTLTTSTLITNLTFKAQQLAMEKPFIPNPKLHQRPQFSLLQVVLPDCNTCDHCD